MQTPRQKNKTGRYYNKLITQTLRKNIPNQFRLPQTFLSRIQSSRLTETIASLFPVESTIRINGLKMNNVPTQDGFDFSDRNQINRQLYESVSY